MKNLASRSLWMLLALLAGRQPIAAQTAYRACSVQLAPGHAAPAVLDAVLAQWPDLRAAGGEFRLERQMDSPGGRYWHFGQYYEGLPILRAGIKAHVDPAGRLRAVMHAAVRVREAAAPVFGQPDSVMAQRFWEQGGVQQAAVRRGWLHTEGGLIPVYACTVHGAGTAEEIGLHGPDGRELYREDLAAYAGIDTSGTGRVFIPNPCTRLMAPYGALFTDQQDQHSPVFETAMDTVVLRNLTWRDGLFRLEGPYVKLEDIASFSVPPAVSADGAFYFTRDQDGFEDVMVYYHLDTFQRYVQRLGFTNLQNRPFRADAHGKADLDQSTFVPNDTLSYILLGDGGVDDAEDADVIIHEYGHALSYAASPGTRSGLERQGLDEGVGDYFAAAYSYDLNPWNWHLLFDWDGHNEFWPGRTAMTSMTYPPPLVNIYTLGELWAATLMQIRLEAGDTVCDRLALQELYGHMPGMSLADGGLLLLDADSVLYGGAHTETIRQYFCQRNIWSGNLCSPAVSLTPQSAAAASISPNPSRGRMYLRHQVPAGSGAMLEIHSLLGQELLREPLRPGVHPVDLPAGAGWVLVFIRSDGGTAWQGKALVLP
ncbi:MAG: hypothetical protein NW241_19555 [Bacteroidia bacterium]|nr:hypothetical protein [Bacteroidia bacterium]